MFSIIPTDDVSESDSEKASGRSEELLVQGQSDNTTVAEYTVMVYYTQEFEDATTDIKVLQHQEEIIGGTLLLTFV